MSRYQDRKLEQKLKVRLDEEVNNLEPGIQERLRDIRREAITHASSKGMSSHWYPDSIITLSGRIGRFNTWQLGGAIAISTVVVLLSFNIHESGIGNNKFESLAVLEDLQILSTSDDLEMYQDLEFYNWLNESQKTG